MIGFWTGYGRRGIAVQHEIWAAAVNGVLYPNIFWMPSYLNPDFTYSASARDMGETFKALKFEGVAKLLMESKRLSDGIALHYSIASVHAASITSNEREHGRKPEDVKRNFSADRDGWVRTMKDLSLQFDFVSYDQLAKGSLSSGNYRVFVMPFSMALSPEEVKAIKAFAAAGGIVIADAAAGLMNEHCSWRDEGLLGDFFGIRPAAASKRSFPGVTGEVVVSAEGGKWGLDGENLSGLEAAEKALEVSDATALVTIAGNPAALVRRAGRGWAVYLNVLYDRYSGSRGDRTRRGAYRRLAGAILRHLKVTPVVEVLAADGKPLEDAIIARYRIGGCRVLAVVKANVAIKQIEGRDGVTVYDDSKAGKIARQEITIRLPKASHVTNVRTGEDLGYTEVVRQSIVVGGTLVLALSPVENSIEITGPSQAALGEHPVFTITSKALGKRVIRCHFFAPDGSFVAAYAKTIVIEAGAGKVVLPSAVNDPSGTWTLKATDLLSGASATAAAMIK
ncbi:MAG: beta-galactosidase trimerization domain-containing protein [Planctomycetes bacterium]|nr:beta-galactosidase trimerization domain-containing protein [Planctomycetota bacterium]